MGIRNVLSNTFSGTHGMPGLVYDYLENDLHSGKIEKKFPINTTHEAGYLYPIIGGDAVDRRRLP